MATDIVTLLMDLGHSDEVRRLGAEGDWGCASAWASAAAGRGEVDEALALLGPFADTGWWPAVVARRRIIADAEERAVPVASPDAWGPGGSDDDLEVLLRSHPMCDGSIHADGVHRLVALLLAQGREDDVRRLSAAPGGSWAATRFAAHLEEQGDRDAALQVLLPFATADAPRLVEECAAMLVRAGRVAEAVEILHEAALFEGGHPYLALPMLVGMAAEHGLHDRVLAIIDDVADRGEGMTVGLWERRAGVLALRGDVDQAIAELSELDEEDAPWVTMLQMARILVDVGHPEEAVARLAAFDDPRVMIEHASLLVRLGRVAEGIEVARGRRLPEPESHG